MVWGDVKVISDTFNLQYYNKNKRKLFKEGKYVVIKRF